MHRVFPVFDWERPYLNDYPEGIWSSYCAAFTNCIVDPGFVVLVAEDEYDPEEGNKTIAKLPPQGDPDEGKEKQQVIAAVVSWKLEPGSKRKGQFQHPDGKLVDRFDMSQPLLIFHLGSRRWKASRAS